MASSSTNGRASGTSTPGSASGTDGPTSEGGTTQRKKTSSEKTEHRQGRQNVEYTREQVTIVERVRKFKHHQYYEILELKTEATDTEVKKRYLLPAPCSVIGGNKLLIEVIDGWRYNYILIRMVLLVLMRLSRVILPCL
jgi:IS4 transposase